MLELRLAIKAATRANCHGFQMAIRSYSRFYRPSQLQQKRTLRLGIVFEIHCSKKLAEHFFQNL
jgi:hypothetical protein